MGTHLESLKSNLQIRSKKMSAEAPKKRRTFKKFSFRGIELDRLLDMNSEEIHNLMNSRHRRSFRRGVSRKHETVIKRMRQAKKAQAERTKAGEQGVRPEPVKTHCRNLTVLPEMVGNIVGVYNGKMFCGIEI